MSNLPASFAKVQTEALQFNQPVSESALQSIGAVANAFLETLLPVGSIIDTMLTETQFQIQLGSPSPARWILADGRNIVGSALNTITGQTNAPDLRGIFTRGKNNGRVDGHQNPDGDLALGTYTADKFASHNHGNGAFVGQPSESGSFFNTLIPGATDFTGGNETAPKNVTVNKMIRIN